MAFSLSGTTITQTGTDPDLSGLQAFAVSGGGGAAATPADDTRGFGSSTSLNNYSTNDAVVVIEFTTGGDVNTDQVIWESGATGVGCALVVSGGQLETYAGNTDALYNSTPIQPNTSYSAAIVYTPDTDDEIRLYLATSGVATDSDLVSTVAFTQGDWCGTDNTGVGSGSSANVRGLKTGTFQGSIDSDLRIYTTNNIADTFTAGGGTSSGIIVQTNGNRTWYYIGNRQLNIDGTLDHDPDTECLISNHQGNTPSINVNGIYNYGKETIANGNTRYSSGTGLVVHGEDTVSQAEWNAVLYGALFIEGTFNGRGGVILSDRCIGFYSGPNIDVLRTRFTKIGTTARRELRFDSDTVTPAGQFVGVVDGFQMSTRRLPPIFSPVFIDAEVVQLANTNHSSDIGMSEIDTSENIGIQTDLGTDDSNGGPNFYRVTNCSAGSNLRTMPKSGVGTNRQLGGSIIQKQYRFVVTDANSQPIDQCKVYTRDTNNGFRKNANGQNHLADKIYSGVTNVNGETPTETIITAITNIDSEGSFDFADWDTTLYNNRYRVDRRGLDDSGDDDYLFGLISYSHLIGQSRQRLKGLGELVAPWTLFLDMNITETDTSVVAGYTLIDTAQQFYDRAKLFLCNNYQGEAFTIVDREANTIDAGVFDVIVDANAANAFAFNGNTLTIKTDQFVGSIITTGVVTLSNGAVVNGSVTDSNGTTVTTTITARDAITQLPIQDARVFIRTISGGGLPVGQVLFNDVTDASGQATFTTQLDVNQPITGKVRRSTSTPLYKTSQITGTISLTGFEATILMIRDD